MEKDQLEELSAELKRLGEQLLESIDFGDMKYVAITEKGASVVVNYQTGETDSHEGESINSVFEI